MSSEQVFEYLEKSEKVHRSVREQIAGVITDWLNGHPNGVDFETPLTISNEQYQIQLTRLETGDAGFTGSLSYKQANGVWGEGIVSNGLQIADLDIATLGKLLKYKEIGAYTPL